MVLRESIMIKTFFRFAEVEMHVLVITLLRRFRLSYRHSPVAIATSFVNKPDRPLKLRFLPRCQGGSFEAAILLRFAVEAEYPDISISRCE